jgi:DegV family protein with EDD domain
MSGRVAVVTDSTACLPDELCAGLTVVPLQVVIRGKSYVEGEPGTSDMLAEALRRRWPATTSRPGPARFVEVYQKLAVEGHEEIVSIHLSGELSGTYDSARLAAREAPVPVRVVDSRTLGMALGFAAVTAAEVARDGATAAVVATAAAERAAASTVLFYVDTLEYLRRGGRIGAAQALVGSALAVKPLLRVGGGRIEPLERVRTTARAIARLEELVMEHIREAAAQPGGRGVDLAVHHVAARARADVLAARLRELSPGVADLRVSEVGAVIGAHAGPGALGVVIAPRTGLGATPASCP